MTTYTIVSKWNSGTFSLGGMFTQTALYVVIGTPTFITPGFADQVVFSGLAILPIRFIGNTVFASYSISPEIGSGISFNTTTGVISGTYTGNTVTVSYQVTGTNSFGSATASFTLSYQRYSPSRISPLAQSGANIEGLNACYYPETNGYNLYPEEWFYTAVADDCVRLETLNLVDNYIRDHEHSWPGLSNRIEDVFSAFITGFLNIGQQGNYTFILSALHSAAIFFDEDPTPLVFIAGEASEVRSDSDTILLTPGRHLMRIYYLNNKGAARLRVEYECAAVGLPRTVITKIATFVGGRAPSFLEMRDVTSFVNGMVKTERPRIAGSLLEGFSIAPALPQGLTLNEVTGVISGSSDAQMDCVYTLTASGPLGECKTAFRLSIGESPLPDLVVRYYAFEPSQEMCNLQAFPASLLTLVEETTDSTLFHPLQPKGTSWSGVPDDVFPGFYAVWKGFIHIPTPGEYTFFLRSADGSRIYFNNEVFMEAWRCSGSSVTSTKKRTVDTAGYYPFEVQYFSNANEFVLELTWKKPDDSSGPIDASFLSHLPSSTLSYATPTAIYYRSVPIPENKPTWFGITAQGTAFQITPALPSGLTLQSTGVISGTPAETSEEITYTVTAMANNVLYTTTLLIKVSVATAPSDLTVTDAAGKPVSTLTLKQFEDAPALKLAAKNARTWRIDPPLPEGLSIDLKTLTLKGKAYQAQQATVHSIVASSSGGSVSVTLTITITGCEYGHYFYTEAGGNSPTALTIRNVKTNETIVSTEGVPAGRYGITLCLPSVDYSYTMGCRRPGQFVCVVNIYRDDGLRYVSHIFPGLTGVHGVFNPEIKEKPVLTASTDVLYLTLREKFSVKLNITGVYKEVVPETPLPATVKYEANYKSLTGYFTEMGDFSVTLSAENDKGKGSVTIVFHVATCEEGKVLVTFYRSEVRNDESMVVASETGEEILNVQFGFNEFIQSVCVVNGDYHVTMRKTTGTWSPGTELLVKDAWDDVLASPIMDDPSGEKTEYFAINYAIVDRLKMRFYNQPKAPSAKWSALDFNDKNWVSADHASFGNFTANTADFRKEFTVDSRHKYTILAFDVEIYDGAIVYINGKEVVRRNLPLAGVTHESMAIDRYDALLWRRTTVPMSDLQNGRNVLAVELHRYAGADTGIVFDVYGSLLSGECMKRTDKGRATDSEHAPSADHQPYMAFDDSLRTTWKESQTPLFLQFNYNYDRFEYINKVVLFAGAQYQGIMPKKFEILGMTGPDEGDVLASVDNRNLFMAPQASAEVFLHNTRAYNAYRLLVEETTGSKSVELAEVVLYTCNIQYCPKQRGWESIYAGSSTFGSCRRNTFGEAHRACSIEKYDAVWSAIDYSNCLPTNPPQNTAYIDFKYMVSNCQMDVFRQVVKARFIDITRDILLAKKENIMLFLERDCSDSETENVCFYVRVTTDLRIADYVYDNMKLLQEQMSYRMYTDPPKELPKGLYFVMVINPLLRTPRSMVVVIVVIVLVALIIIGTAIMLFMIHSGKLEKRVKGGVNRKRTIESLQKQMETTRKEKKSLLE